MLKKNWQPQFLHFTLKDRIFAITVTVAITGSLVLPRFFAPTPPPLSFHADSTLVLAMDTLQKYQGLKPTYRREENPTAYQYERSTSNSYTPGELFFFDPNTLTIEEWKRLGLAERTGKTILNYIGKGGRFYRPEDLKKIWGMPEVFYERIKGYVQIKATKKEYSRFSEKSTPYVRDERKPSVMNVNLADTAAFIALPGIGSKLSARIVAFREKLGGFYSVEQIGETYGLPDSTFQKIKHRLHVDENTIRKININTATKEELKTHPYIRWNLANAIVEYRNQHGAFKQLDDLKNIILIDELTFQKISHYLSL